MQTRRSFLIDSAAMTAAAGTLTAATALSAAPEPSGATVIQELAPDDLKEAWYAFERANKRLTDLIEVEDDSKAAETLCVYLWASRTVAGQNLAELGHVDAQRAHLDEGGLGPWEPVPEHIWRANKRT